MITQNIDISELLIVFWVNIFIKLAWLDIKRAASFFDDNKYDDEWMRMVTKLNLSEPLL